LPDLAHLPIEDRWILSKTSDVACEVQEALAEFQFSRAVTLARDFFWDSVCDWYLELVKLRVREGRQAAEARTVLAFVLDQSLRLLHPFVPFITERLWSQLNQIAPQRGLPGVLGSFEVKPAGWRAAGESDGLVMPSPVEDPPSRNDDAMEISDVLIVAPYPPEEGWPDLVDAAAEDVFEDLQTATRAVREVRQTQKVPPRQQVDITIRVPAERVASMQREAPVIQHLANVGKVNIDPEATAPRNAATLVVGDMQIFVHDVIDPEAERARLTKELGNLDKQITGLSGKLGNDGFVKNAPQEVVMTERQRLVDLQSKRDQLQQTISAL
jgi:valyl-tRNA synthetase